jgi:hypothetical protein
MAADLRGLREGPARVVDVPEVEWLPDRRDRADSQLEDVARF